jgi:hypothetical protein
VKSEVQYGRTSLIHKKAGPEKLLAIVRSEWGIENSLHYRRDVTFQEDHTPMTDKRMGRTRAIVNNVVVSIIYSHGFTNHAQARIEFCASPGKALAIISGL